jgi:hypothetical protein
VQAEENIYINEGGSSRTLPNVVVEWLTLLFRVREVTGSNLVFSGFPQSVQANAGIVPQN